MLSETLSSLGLSGYKNRLYTSLLTLGKATVPEIAKKAVVPVNKAYADMEWLYEQGYISLSNKKPLVYKVVDPKLILSSKLDAEIKELERLKKEISRLKISEAVEKQDVTILYGRDNFFNKMKEQLKKSEFSVDATIETSRVDSELLRIEEAVIGKGLKMRFIAAPFKDYLPRIKKHLRAGVKVRFLEPENVRFTIWDKKLVTLRMHEMGKKDYFSIWIESPALARILADYFNKLWEKARSS